MSTAVLSVGSNLGDRLSYLQGAVDAFRAWLVAVSPVYETAPWGNTEQDDFLNAVMIVNDPAAGPRDWLACAQAAENAAGRERTIVWGPRTLDVDVLLYDDIELDDADLTIPHPRLFERDFVLVPLRDVAPERVTRLALLNASARPGSDVQQDAWARLRARLEDGDFAGVAADLARGNLPEHRRGDDALAVKVDPDGGATWRCHRCHWKGGLPAPGRERCHAVEDRRQRDTRPPPPAGFPAVASRLWASRRPIGPGTVAARYLAGRGCALPPPDGHLAWHPEVYHPAEERSFPALLALVTHALTGEPMTLHQTFLAPDGSGKAPVAKPRLLVKGGDKAGGVVLPWCTDQGRGRNNPNPVRGQATRT
jgi:2-amino-4-hydroxy-6-hydroxymethyldihydropteridine diphosphokinase